MCLPINFRAARAAIFRIAVLLLAALSVGLVQPAHAQSDVSLSSVLIQVWPEYDQPSALVIISGVTAEDVETPVELTFTLPETATLNAAAYQDETTGDLLLAESTQDGQQVTMTSPNGHFFIEFYDDTLFFDGDTRSYSMTWQAPYNIDELAWQVQQPFNATDLTLGTEGTVTDDFDQFGLPVKQTGVGSVEAGQEVTLDFTYTKPDDVLSASQITPPTTTDETVDNASAADAAEGPDTWLIVVLLAVGLALVGGGAYWYISQMRTPVRSSARRGSSSRSRSASRRSQGHTSRGGSRSSQGQKFCTQCGGRVADDDVFCRHCGAKLK